MKTAMRKGWTGHAKFRTFEPMKATYNEEFGTDVRNPRGNDEVFLSKQWTGILMYLFYMSTTGYELNAEKQLAGLTTEFLQRMKLSACASSPSSPCHHMRPPAAAHLSRLME